MGLFAAIERELDHLIQLYKAERQWRSTKKIRLISLAKVKQEEDCQQMIAR